MISWVVILGGLTVSLYHVDFHSEDIIYSVWCPISCIFFSITFMLKLVFKYEWARDRDSSSSGGGSGFGGFGGDGGGGGGDGGC